MMSGLFGSIDSLLVPVTLNELTPESRSAAEMVATVTNLWFGGQSIQFAAGSPESAGGVLSILIPPIVAEATLPARSWHVPVTCWFVPSVVSNVGAGGLPAARPESASAQAKLIVTFVLLQPAGFAEGVREPLIDGGVLSILIGSVCAGSIF
jgi:hypothetical protein